MLGIYFARIHLFSEQNLDAVATEAIWIRTTVTTFCTQFDTHGSGCGQNVGSRHSPSRFHRADIRSDDRLAHFSLVRASLARFTIV